jgi:hypothetical protein
MDDGRNGAITGKRIIAPMTALMIPATKLPVRDPIRGNDALYFVIS